MLLGILSIIRKIAQVILVSFLENSESITKHTNIVLTYKLLNTALLNVLDDERTTSANLGNDHGFINKEYSLHWYEAF